MNRIKEFINEFIGSKFEGGKHNKLVRDGLGSIVINFVNKGLNVLLGILLVRLIGIEGYGVYNFVYAAVILICIPAEFGFPNLLIRETAKGLTNEEPGKVKGLLRWSFLLTGLITAVLLLVSFFVIIHQYRNQDLTRIEYLAFLVGLALIPFMAYLHLLKGALQGLKRIIIGQLPEQVLLPALNIIVLAIYFFVPSIELSPLSALTIRWAVTAGSLIVSVIFIIKFLPIQVKKVKTIIIDGKKWFKSSTVMALSSGMTSIKNRGNIILLGILATDFEIGAYQIALSASLIASIILTSTNSVVAPRFSSLFFSGKIKKLQRLVTIHSQLVFISNIFITFLFIFFGKYFLTLFFGAEAAVAYIPLLILLFGKNISSLVGSVGFLLNMTGHENQTMFSTGISLVLNLVLNLFLIPTLGSTGAAIGTSLSLALAQFIMWFYVKKFLKINSIALQGGFLALSSNEGHTG